TVLSDTKNISISADGGNQITGTDTRVEARQAVKIEADTNNLIGEAAVVKSKQAGIDITAAIGGNQIAGAGTKVAASGPVTISAATNNTVSDGAFVRAENAGIGITGEAVNTIDGSEVKAQGGALTMGNENLTTDTVENRIRNAAAVTASENVELTGDANAISGASSVEAGLHVSMTADTQNAVVDSTVTAKAGNITLSDVGSSVASLQNVVTSSAGEMTTLTAGGNVTIAGENIITGTDPGATRIKAENGSISIHDDNYIRNVALEALGAEGDVSIITGAGKDTWIEDSSISGETVLIAGDVDDGRSDDKLAVVTGDAMKIISRGEDDGAGITLNNVSVQDTVRNEPNIMAQNDGNIILRNRVDLENGTLSIENAATSTGRISVDGDTVLNMKAASTLNGRLTGAGIINKSGGDELLLNYDHTSFNGTIYANGSHSGNPADGSVADSANPGSWITVSGAGVGSGASIVLKNTDLVITAPGTQIGTLDTTWDEAGVNNEHLTGGTLISDGSSSDGSYTKDGNSRADFTTVGSVLEVNKAAPGDVVAASDMNLSDATLIKLNAEIAEDGSASSDVIQASGTINAAARTGLNSTSTATAPSTARVYVMHNDAAATAAEGARTTIMQGTMATDINEDVLYDVAESGNGTYLRILQERNVHLENGGDHVDLVYSKNYRSASKTPQMQQVANALREISDTFHHSEGTLAASPNRLHNLIDAFDYTRSEGAAQRGLQSVAGTGNVLPRLMMFDSSRRHLENLRGQMLMPVCADANGMGGVVRRNNVWMTYTSSHDELCGDAYLEDYSRSANGAMLGIDRSVNCKLRVGLSLGYEESTGKSGSSRIEADTFFVDAYAAGVTGRFKHRASVGLATSSFDTNRNVLVEAGYHTFVGTGKGSVDSLSLNFGYEISTDYKLSETATLTPYAALNLSWHKLDTMRERGMGEAGLVTAYDNEWQSEIILGVSYNRLFTVLRNQAPALFYADAAMHLELFNDRVSVKNRFLGASASWRAESMNRQPLYFELGVGVAVPLSPGWTATAGAAYEIGPDRAGVSGNVGVQYRF
ncbi:MAG: autotransporter domain-containing protein, partial [Akkermansia sp.]|nr:autotransporter domain-containing protein [Akkermansia sp.]